MSTRISSTQVAQSSLYSIGIAYNRFADAQSKINTGKQLQTPSDDPSGIAQSLNFREQFTTIGQYEKNITQAKAFLGTTDTALNSVNLLLRQARTLAVQGASDTTSQEARVELANQVQDIITQLGNIGNTTYGTRYIFAGQNTSTRPFDPTTGGTFNYTGGKDATGNGQLQLDVGRSESIQINVTGDAVLTPILTSLTKLRDDISYGATNAVSDVDIANLDANISTVLTTRADIGSKIQRLDQQTTRYDLSKDNLTKLISSIEDTDFTKAVVEYQTAQTAYQAAVQSTAKIFQTSLLDFLR